MILNDLTPFTVEPDIPPGYIFRAYADNDLDLWSELQSTTDSFVTTEAAGRHFRQEFGDTVRDELTRRCFFLQTEDQSPVGSAMAWYGEGSFGREYGRLHWVVVHPDFRGKGLGQYLIRSTLHRMTALHNKAYLTTQTTSYPAINIYLQLGFRPFLSRQQDQVAWELLRPLLKFTDFDLSVQGPQP